MYSIPVLICGLGLASSDDGLLAVLLSVVFYLLAVVTALHLRSVSAIFQQCRKTGVSAASETKKSK